MKRLLLTVLFLAVPTFAFAQDGGGEEPTIGILKQIAAMVITAILIPLANQLLKPWWAGMGGFVKTLGPVVIVPALGVLAAFATTFFGVEIDLSTLMAIFGTASALGISATTAFKIAKTDSKAKGVVNILKAATGTGKG